LSKKISVFSEILGEKILVFSEILGENALNFEIFGKRIGERYLIYTKDYRKDGATTLLPVFMTMFL